MLEEWKSFTQKLEKKKNKAEVSIKWKECFWRSLKNGFNSKLPNYLKILSEDMPKPAI